ncbi:MAG: molecular chaperone HtpG [Eubacteriales bacterium]|nr:molecular chaperone HtpG [Eubacteriales bacterium]
MALQQFQTESKRILDLMVNSIYTHKEIFLRELISNASDAIDKLYYRQLQDGTTGLSHDDYVIEIVANKDARTLTIRDNGCGMTKDELKKNLGTIADSGTLRFKTEHEMTGDQSVIGQFGVGFYSAFMVAKEINVTSRAFGTDEANRWKSKGVEGFSVTAAEKDGHGTEIVLTLKDDTDDERYSEFLDEYRLKSLVKKYSDYIRYPIRMEVTKSRPKEDNKEEYETYTEVETLNSMVPLWKRSKSELKEEDYNQFYQDKFFDYEAPLRVIHTAAEGAVSYNALMFIPKKAPYDYYSKEFSRGLQLYANGVLIMDKCEDLLPDYFSFVKGLVDSPDLSLNISRELLQHDRQLKVIANNIEKKIKNELSALLLNEREKYEEFYAAFGLQLKYGVYAGYGMNKDKLQDLLLFRSMQQDKLITLKEYVDAMPEAQKSIYYAAGSTIGHVEKLPQLELLKDKGYDVLLLTEDVDEFCLQMLREYSEKEIKSVSAAELDLVSDEEKETAKKKSEEHKDLLAAMKDALGDKVKEVRLSARLKSHPVCLATDGALSLEMERVLNAMPMDNKVKAERVLELNPEHPVFTRLCALSDTDGDTLKAYAEILYTQALMMEGILPEDPAKYTDIICELMK